MFCRVLVAFALAVRVSAYHFFPVPGEDVYGNPLVSGADTKYQHIFAHANEHGSSFRRPWPPTEDAPTRATSFAPPRHQALVKPVIGNMSVERMRVDLGNLTSFLTRHAKVQDGRNSQLWLLSQINDVADSYNAHGPLVTVFEFGHDAFPQRSIVARIHGSNITQDPSVVILGAHQDSKNYRHPTERSPGADDDGSGTVTILEAFRALARVGYAPARTVEFHWYAAEEDGLLGSLDVVKAYKGLGKSIAAMNQYDMTAWVANGTDEAIGVVSSDVDIGLMALNVQLVNEYLDVPSVVFRFPKNAGSDHMGWYWDGYPAAFLTEGLFKNSLPFVHTPDDRIDISPEFSFEHMHRFAQHAAAFAIEVAGGKHLNALL